MGSKTTEAVNTTGDLPDTETELTSCALPGGSLPLSQYKNLGVKLGVGKTTQL